MSGAGNNSSQSVGALLKELSECCRSEFLSEDGLRAIIERHNNCHAAPKFDDPSHKYIFFYQACFNEKVTEGILRYLLECFPNAIRFIPDYDFFSKACRNQSVTEGILRCLLEYFPKAVRYTDILGGELPLHYICLNINVTLVMVQLLIDAFPESLRQENDKGRIPLHKLCLNNNLDDDDVGLGILKLLLERCPESLRHTSNRGSLPIHAAAMNQSLEFCRLLIEAYPGSERITNEYGVLPFHFACALNTVATAKYLYQLYSESIHVADNDGRYPIHFAIKGLKRRKGNPETAIEMVQFLLDCDPDVVLQKHQGAFPLYWVCVWAIDANTVRLNAYLKVLQILYDAHPEAIDEVASDVRVVVCSCKKVETFIITQSIYARQAKDPHLMTTPDENGQLPLHKALRDDVKITLGSIKLLVKGNPSAITCADNSGTIPLHVACQHIDSASIVEYLLDLDPKALRALDFDDNAALHYACRGANHTIISLLLEKYCAVSISKRNAHNQLPIHLLLENNEFCDEESVEYTESIYRLLRAYPETIINYSV
jgi:ankyrin repeat protein